MLITGTVTYVITGGNVNNVFAIDSSSGEIKIIAALDFDLLASNIYVLDVEGRDNDGTSPLTGSSTVSLTITDANDNTPSCTPVLQSVQLPESTLGSTSIATLTCSDEDSGANAALTYSVISVNGDTSSTLFEIDASGVVTTAALTTLDYETTNTYVILLRIEDGGATSLSFTATVNLDITDVNEAAPAFQSTPYSTNVPETTSVGAAVYTVTATDSDGTNTVTYALNPSNTYFQIDPNSGQIYTIAEIDYDTLGSPTITLTVEATDDGSPVMQSSSEIVTITVTDANDGTPIFSPGVYSGSVLETSLVDTTVTTVSVTDIDDSSFSLSFASGNSDNIFRIENNGEVIVDDITNLDYDTGSRNYVLVAQAVDSGGNTGTASIAIEITNINEHSPTLTAVSNVVNIAENSATGITVDDVNATDSDYGADGEITYSISSISNSGDGLFTINPTNGVVSISGSLDRETQSEYEITVLATDAGTNPS